MRKYLHSLWSKKIIRFGVIGSCNTLLDLVMLNILVLVVGLGELPANTISVCIGISISFFLNRMVVFQKSKESKKSTLKQFAKFFMITGFGVLVIQNITILGLGRALGLHDIGIHGLLELVGLGAISIRFINLNIAKILAVLVGMCWNFIMYNFVVFKSGEAKLEEEILSQ